jgi:hypothetical protein
MSRHSFSLILTLTILALGAVAAWGATASFTPPPEQGTIFAVINADRSPGARSTSISVTWGPFRRTVGRGNPYGNCSGSVAGFVLMIRNTAASTRPFTLSTTGTIVRPPYQGIAPPEVSHACYKLEKMRARF